jgi:hypothetical protein
MGLILKEYTVYFIFVFDGVDPCEPTKIINETDVVPTPPPQERNAGPQTSVCASCKGAVENYWNYKKGVDGSWPFDKHCTH